jgi:hypothetical protein
MIRSCQALMLIGSATLLVSACATDPTTPVASDTQSSNLVVRASGSGDWEVSCSGISRRGRDVSADINGRGSDNYDFIVLQDLVSGSCTYSAGDRPLQITLPEQDTNCPFEAASPDFCRTDFPAGASGAFEFSPE